jgi:enterochelin esterase family protein
MEQPTRWPSNAPQGPLPEDADPARLAVMTCYVRGAALALFPNSSFAPASEPPMELMRWPDLDLDKGWYPAYNMRAVVFDGERRGVFHVRVAPRPAKTEQGPPPAWMEVRRHLQLTRDGIAPIGYYRGVTIEVPFRPLPLDQSSVIYAHGPDSFAQQRVPRGQIVEFMWRESTIYPGTSRRFWVHVPAQYDPFTSADLLVFQDGWYYLDPAGELRVGIVLDNLLHHGDIPITISVFVDPGVFEGADEPKNRNAEYDAFDDRYATFLLAEIVPRVTERYAIADDPARWGVCGGSSGGNCSFTVAWLRPDRFRRVLCGNASFVQMPRGNPYPDLISSVARKPLRIFMQASHRDFHWNEPEMNWFSSNLRVAAALAEAGYDFRLVIGDGGHNPNFLGAVLPDALRWLCRP